MPELAADRPPPPDYYAANLRSVLEHVRSHYADLLNADELAFADAFELCSPCGQRLFARLVSRKGPWIRIDSLNYPEVRDRQHALNELRDCGLAELNGEAPADALLAQLTKAERMQLFPDLQATRKVPQIHECVSRYSDGNVRLRLAARYPWVRARGYRVFNRIKLLFFGDERQDLSAFVLQDLGLLRYERYSLSRHLRQFANRIELERLLRLAELDELSGRVDELPDLAPQIADELWMGAQSRLEQRRRDRVLNRLGRWHERRGDFDAALDCFARSTTHPAGERVTRILHRLGDARGVNQQLCRMRVAPRSVHEEDFAGRFGKRRRGERFRITVQQLESVGGCAPSASIEQRAIHVLTAERGHGWHLENHFPLGIAGLAFWSVVFADVPGAFVNPFQTAPVDLFWPDFLTARRQQLEQQLQKLSKNGMLTRAMVRTWNEKFGVANRLISWRRFDAAMIETVLDAIPEPVLLRLALFTLRNLHRLRSGFPDLLVIYAPNEYEFVEVKGPTDQLQSNQRIWLAALTDLDVPARVLKFRP